jgi:hypothetical protein
MTTKANTKKVTGTPRTMESWVLMNGKIGDVFFTIKGDKHLSAIALSNNRKIKTERVVLIKTVNKKPIAEKLTKVTIVG